MILKGYKDENSQVPSGFFKGACILQGNLKVYRRQYLSLNDFASGEEQAHINLGS